jgi:hypothetical protein
MLFYRAALPLSSRPSPSCPVSSATTGVSIGSCRRKLNAGRRAILVLVYMRKGETFIGLAAGFAIGTTTAWRYMEETVALLAAKAPKLRQAIRAATKVGYVYVVLDGTLIPVERVAADRPFYFGKYKKHGMNPQVIASPDGHILWVSEALPVRCTTRSRMDLRLPGRTRDRRSGHACRQGLRAKHTREAPVPGEEAGITETGQPLPRDAPGARRARECPARDLENPP